ncbi:MULTISPECIES: cellulase family glycosylhydrolase [unclassified Sphingopyxis]|uniref:cellulase family glycosylhydrolase n=1 Tax=unclassified Sphingopyxis TaxID=2614943 RepID=UPI0007364AF4|nr:MULTISPECIES: cellulase family glycosylhydrolase [unclassified Sphingopyxis]KTE36456.1 glycosyl hydrolase family 5 [Sphingopyxis sp. HIX]KTE83847.1 glycosyl hydrolase family 5 [Sphingopyxis sp. HXXIV]
MKFGSVFLALVALFSSTAAQAEGWLRVEGTQIVDDSGQPVILRGMGLGGWMLQEGYMLKLGEVGQQHKIRAKLVELVGEERTAEFYRAWLDNHTTEADIAQMAKWGFNSVRLPIHFDQLTLPADREPKAGTDTWHAEGFERIDKLLAWSKKQGLYLILDLHAAPGGQGNDLAISDRDPAKPSLWESEENQRKTVALWTRLAARYKDEPWIGGYDLINEPNWSFATPGKGNGCDETESKAVWELQRRITAAIRGVDARHMIIVEGNCWGNNYKGLPPAWDANMVLSFHKYWNRNDAASIADIVKLRTSYGRPVWLGESGENSNVWFRDAIALVEGEGIGWNFWPLKKIGFNQPLEIVAGDGWMKIVAWATGKGPKPDADEAFAAMMQLAENSRFTNNIPKPDVIDAMFRQPRDASPKAFVSRKLGATPLTIRAVDYDLGPAAVAYNDTVDANYHVATGGERTPWNNGTTFRNDGVDIAREADGTPYVADFVSGEWMRYALDTAAPGRWNAMVRVRSAKGGRIALGNKEIAVAPGSGWQNVAVGDLSLGGDTGALLLRAVDCSDCQVADIRLEPR